VLEKTTNAVTVLRVIGSVCVEPEPPPAPLPVYYTGLGRPRPPRPIVSPPAELPPAAPPEPPETLRLTISTYEDTYGRCWRVLRWEGLSGTIFEGGSVGTIERIPIDCSEL